MCQTLLVFLCIVLVFPQLSIFTVAAQETPTNIQIQSIAVSPDGDKVFILNDDSTVSVYDISQEKFIVSNEVVFLPTVGKSIPTNVVISPLGHHFLVGGSDSEFYHFAVYATDDFLKDDGLFKTPVALSQIPKSVDNAETLVAFAPDEEKIYLVDAVSREMSVFSYINTKMESSVLDIPERLVNFSINTTGTLGFIVTLDSGRLFIVNLGTGKIVDRYEVGGRPIRMYYSDTDQSVYVASKSSDTVSIVDLKEKKVRSVVAGSFPVRLANNRDGSKVFVASNGDGAIFEISKDVSRKLIELGTPGYGTYPIDIWHSNETGMIVAINPYSQDVYIADVGTGKIVFEEKLGGWLKNIVGSESGSIAAILRQNSNELTLVDTKSKTVKNISSTGSVSEGVFSAPMNLQYHPNTGLLFVGNLGTGDISVVDGTTLNLVKKIPVGFQPHTMYLSEELDKLFISNTSGGFVTIIDLSDDQYGTYNVKTGGMPQVVQGLEAIGKAYVALSVKNTVGVIDMHTNKLTKEIPLGSGNLFPFSLTRSEDRKEVYVTNYGADTVSIIDAITDTVKKTITVGEKPLWISYHPATALLFVTIEGANEIVAIDPEKLEVVKRLSTVGIPYRVLGDDATEFVYVTHRGDKNVEIFKADKTKGLIPFGVREMDYVGEFGLGYNMWTMDTTRLNAETKRVYISSTAHDIVVITNLSRDSEGILQLTKVGAIFENGEVYQAPSTPQTTRRMSGVALVTALVAITGVVMLILWKIRPGTPPGSVPPSNPIA